MSKGRSVGGLRGESEGIKTYKLVQNRNGDVKYNTGNTVNNIEITTYAARWLLEALGATLDEGHDFLTTLLYI